MTFQRLSMRAFKSTFVFREFERSVFFIGAEKSRIHSGDMTDVLDN